MKRYLRMLFLCMLFLLMLQAIALGEERTFLISTSYKSLLSTPEQTGMLDRLIKEAFRRIGLRTEIVFTPTERSLFDVNAGLLDGEINRIAGMEQNYPNLVRVPEPNMTMHFVAFAKHPHHIDDWDSIRELQVGVVSGWRILEEHTSGFPDRFLLPTETELFTMLHKDRLDIALYDMLTGYETLSRLNYPEIRHLEPHLICRDMFLYMHKEHKELVDRIAAALREMKEDGTYDSIVTETTSHLGFNAR